MRKNKIMYLAWIGELNHSDWITSPITLICSLALWLCILYQNIITLVISAVLLLILIYLFGSFIMRFHHYKNTFLRKSYLYKLLKGSLFVLGIFTCVAELIDIAILFHFIAPEQKKGIIFLLGTISAFPISVSIALVFPYISNLLFYTWLVRIFPYRYQNIDQTQLKAVGLKELSKYMDLESEKGFLWMTIIQIILTILLVAICYSWIYKLYIEKLISVDNKFDMLFAYFVHQRIFSLSHTIGLLSLAITIFTIINPKKEKMIRDAEKRKNHQSHATED